MNCLVKLNVFRSTKELCRTFSVSGICGKKGLIRRPLRVFTPDQTHKLATGEKVQLDPQPTSLRAKFPDELTNKRFTLPEGLSYVKLEDGDKRLRNVMGAKVKKDRLVHGMILLEGQRLVCDAIDAGATIKALYFSKVEHLEGIPLTELDADLYKVTYRQMQLFSEVATTSGLMAIAQLPGKMKDSGRESSLPAEVPGTRDSLLPITVVCDNIRDPGNMGTIIRSVAATGCKRIILTKGCVDPWDPKVLRAGAGSHFRCTIIDNVAWEMVRNYVQDCEQVFLADNKARYVDFVEGSHPGGVLRSLVDMEENHSVVLEGGKSRGVKKGNTIHKVENINVYDADFTTGSVALVLGGETHGLSISSYKLAAQMGGVSINLPMAPGIESINAAMAVTGILFEAKRQYSVQSELEEASRRHGYDEAV